jgi:hypothetical protein
MDKPLSPTAHGVADYLSAATFAAAPNVLQFPPVAATLARSLGASYAGLSLATAYPLGAAKLVPFPAHLTMDAVMAPALAAAPWLFGFAESRAARNFFLGMAAVTAIVTSLTQRRRAA